MTYAYIRKRDLGTTWEQLLLAADSDFVAFILLSCAGILESTSLWMAAHSLEKYLKSWLLKSDPEADPRKFGHRLDSLWGAARSRFSQHEIFQVPEYDAFIDEVNMDGASTSLRYGYGIDLRNPIFARLYASSSCALRMAILGEQGYRERGAFGLCEASFGSNTSFFENPQLDTKGIVCAEVDRLLRF